ncbi:MAG: diadenylate cyclase CdaA, partial [Erysipelotrichaceae bacterium]|nr:diadenylate cyclase CdaA [Erysipelotrichaceae bacterium]
MRGISLTYETIMQYLRVGIDIIVVWILLNYIIKVVGNNQRTVQIFQGVIMVVIVQAVAKLFGLTTVYWLANNIVSWGFLAIIVIFQPEIRSILERLGKGNALARMSILSSNEKEKLIDELLTATASLSSTKTGALISIEQTHSLNDFISTGIRLNSVVSAELLCSLFVTSTPLHDGAVIIQGDKIACASAYFPPTSQDLPSRYGARHRAAIGISEITDAITIVVSEESGRVSVTYQGKIMHMNEKKLREFLNRIILNREVTAVASGNVKQDSVNVAQLLKQTGSEEEIDFKNKAADNKNTSKMKTFGKDDFKKEEATRENEVVRPSETITKVVSDAVSEESFKKVEFKVVSVPRDV